MLPVRTALPKFIALLTGAFLLFPLAACDSKSSAKPENFIAGLNAHFADHPECLFPNPPIFPYETSDPGKTKQMNALVTAQLLDVAVEPDIHASRYTPTAAGGRVAPALLLRPPRRLHHRQLHSARSRQRLPRDPGRLPLHHGRRPGLGQVRPDACRVSRHGSQHQRDRLGPRYPRRHHGRLASPRLGNRQCVPKAAGNGQVRPTHPNPRKQPHCRSPGIAGRDGMLRSARATTRRVPSG
jgi:hypothetical protein